MCSICVHCLRPRFCAPVCAHAQGRAATGRIPNAADAPAAVLAAGEGERAASIAIPVGARRRLGCVSNPRGLQQTLSGFLAAITCNASAPKKPRRVVPAPQSYASGSGSYSHIASICSAADLPSQPCVSCPQVLSRVRLRTSPPRHATHDHPLGVGNGVGFRVSKCSGTIQADTTPNQHHEVWPWRADYA